MGHSGRTDTFLLLSSVFLFSCYFLNKASASKRLLQQQQHQLSKQQQVQHQYYKQIQAQKQGQQPQYYNKQHQLNKQQQVQHQYKKQIQAQKRGEQPQYYNYNKNYPNYYSKNHYQNKYYKHKKYKYIKWPRIRGRCLFSPWNINGENPVIEESKKGNMVVLFLLKSNDPFSYNQMQRLNDLAEHYRQIGRKITVMALNHRSRTLPAIYRTRFKNIKIYDEPAEKNIYALLRAGYRQMIIYDKCGRQQYHFGYPYSWLGYPWVKLAIENVRRFHEDYALCGRCKEYVPPTTTNPNQVGINATTSTTSLKPTDRTVDGPYTNIPVAAKNA